MSIPEKFRSQLFARLWSEADRIDWIRLNTNEKRQYYETWTRDEAIGGLLRRYLEPGKIRVYLKDTILKEYTRSRLSNPDRIYRVLNVEFQGATQAYEKPHGHLLDDGKVISWGKANDWKTVLLATYERAFLNPNYVPFASVLLFSTGRFHEESAREIVKDVAKRLGIHHLAWLD